MSLIVEIGELLFDGPTTCGATLGKSMSNGANPVWLPGWVNGLMDAEGIPVGVVGAHLHPPMNLVLQTGNDQSCCLADHTLSAVGLGCHAPSVVSHGISILPCPGIRGK